MPLEKDRRKRRALGRAGLRRATDSGAGVGGLGVRRLGFTGGEEEEADGNGGRGDESSRGERGMGEAERGKEVGD